MGSEVLPGIVKKKVAFKTECNFRSVLPRDTVTWKRVSSGKFFMLLPCPSKPRALGLERPLEHGAVYQEQQLTVMVHTYLCISFSYRQGFCASEPITLIAADNPRFLRTPNSCQFTKQKCNMGAFLRVFVFVLLPLRLESSLHVNYQ